MYVLFELNPKYYVKQTCPLLCPLGHIFCCALLYIVNVPPLSLFHIFNKCDLLCALFCALRGTYFVVPFFIYYVYFKNLPLFVPYRTHILLCPPLYSKCAPSLSFTYLLSLKHYFVSVYISLLYI